MNTKRMSICLVLVWLGIALMITILGTAGCTQKHAKVTLPPVLNDDGTIKIAAMSIEYDEINLMSEDKSEGIWFEADPVTGILLEFNKSETTMESARKLIEYGIMLASPVPIPPGD